MGSTTIKDAVEKVARFCSLTNDQTLTPYSDTLMRDYLQSAHEFIKGEQEWDELTCSFIRELDGTTGKITEVIQKVTDWKKIKRIYHESFEPAMPVLSSYVNPLASTLLLGYRGLAQGEDNMPPLTGRYLVQFFPLTLTGKVMFAIEQEIDWTDDNYVIPIDFWLHVYHAAYSYLADDGSNPRQEAKYQGYYQKRMKQIKANNNSRPVLTNPNQVVPNDWFEADAPYV